MEKQLNKNGDKIKVNKGRVFEMSVYKHFNIDYSGIDNIKRELSADLMVDNCKYDIKTERGSIATKYGDSRTAKDLTPKETKAFALSLIQEYKKSIPDKRTYLFGLTNFNASVCYSMNKTQWVKFITAFIKVTNATDKGQYLKIRLDAKSDRMFSNMVTWLESNGIQHFNI